MTCHIYEHIIFELAICPSIRYIGCKSLDSFTDNPGLQSFCPAITVFCNKSRRDNQSFWPAITVFGNKSRRDDQSFCPIITVFGNKSQRDN